MVLKEPIIFPDKNFEEFFTLTHERGSSEASAETLASSSLPADSISLKDSFYGSSENIEFVARHLSAPAQDADMKTDPESEHTGESELDVLEQQRSSRKKYLVPRYPEGER